MLCNTAFLVFICPVSVSWAEQGFCVPGLEQEDCDDKAAASSVLLQTTAHFRGPPLPAASLPTIDAFNHSSMKHFYPGWSRAEGKRKLVSMEEANLTCNDISFFGSATPKLPQSLVASVAALEGKESKHTSLFNFQGSLGSSDLLAAAFSGGSEKGSTNGTKMALVVYERRSWVLPFSAEHFSDSDVLVITDAPGNHKPLGSYDRTNDFDGYFPKHDKANRDRYYVDVGYYQNMIQSTFTLCPGGDSPWSMRFYEAILAGSIPVIRSFEEDLSDHSAAVWWNKVGYTYFTVDQIENMLINHSWTSAKLKSIADKNYELLLMYQTWTHGDKVPPAYAKFSKPCSISDACMEHCCSHDQEKCKNV